jgi:O-antigen/teichoic acid export membrane protein
VAAEAGAQPGTWLGRSRLAVFRHLTGQRIRRLGWGVADQGMSSISNFAVNIYIARTLGAVQYGAFALAYVTYSFALNASRGLATDPLLVRFSGTDVPTWRRAVAGCTGTAAAVGLAAGACVLAAALALSGTARWAFLALGLTLPGLLLQDSWRFAFFALGRGGQAFLNDTVWVIVLLPAMVVLRVAGHANVFWFVFAWGASGAVAAAVGPLQAKVLPRMSAARSWLSRHRDLGPRYLAEGTANSASAQLRNYGIGILLGLAAVGYVQAASTLMGPFMVVFFGMALVTLPEAARLWRQSSRKMVAFCALYSSGLAVLGLAWGVVLLVILPHGLGHWLLKDVWRPTYPLVLPLTISIMGGCLGGGASTGLHALGAARRSLRAMVIASTINVIGGVLGAVAGGAVGTVRGLAVTTWIGTLVYWWQLRAALREAGTAHAPGRTLSSRPGGRHRGPTTTHRRPHGGEARERSNRPRASPETARFDGSQPRALRADRSRPQSPGPDQPPPQTFHSAPPWPQAPAPDQRWSQPLRPGRPQSGSPWPQPPRPHRPPPPQALWPGESEGA